MTVSDFIKIKTNYLRIALKTILLSGILFLIILIQVFIFFLLFGSGAGSGRIADLWYVELIINFLPILIIGVFLTSQIVSNYKNQKYSKFKTDLITLILIIVIYSIRYQLELLIT